MRFRISSGLVVTRTEVNDVVSVAPTKSGTAYPLPVLPWVIESPLESKKVTALPLNVP